MSFIAENLQVIATLGSAAIVYGMLRRAAKKDLVGAKNDIESIKENLKEIKQNIKSIDHRLSKLEGAFCERGHWEGRLYSMSKNIEERK
jgi:predicted  nucleic acid-binding Zn-ribbon protein